MLSLKIWLYSENGKTNKKNVCCFYMLSKSKHTQKVIKWWLSLTFWLYNSKRKHRQNKKCFSKNIIKNGGKKI